MSEAVTNKCAKCGGISWGRPESTNDFMCLCAVAPKPTLQGWECPRCHKIHSPFSLTCDCMPDYVIYITDNTKEEPK